jgi:hypothetical protein
MTELARQPLAGRLPRSLTSRAGLRNPAAAQVPAGRRGEPPAVCSRQNFEPTLTAPECKPASGVYLRKRAQRCCSTARYTQGVRADIARLQDQGFELIKLRNSWSDDQYKGINSQWIEPDTGQRFELQFHSRISLEAKQLTHGAYERIRTRQPDEFEQMVLEAFQKKVTAAVPVPPGAADIPDYPKRGTDAR